MTLASESKALKPEADESYKLAAGRVHPDLTIDVVFTSGEINQLKAYKQLLIPEIWFWEVGVPEVDHLRQQSNKLDYERASTNYYHVSGFPAALSLV